MTGTRERQGRKEQGNASRMNGDAFRLTKRRKKKANGDKKGAFEE